MVITTISLTIWFYAMERTTNNASSYLNLTTGNVLENEEDPGVLAMSYMMYKIGKCSFLGLGISFSFSFGDSGGE